MKVLIIGQGGREHALIHALRSSSQLSEISVYPGNDGMRDSAMPIQLPDLQAETLAKWTKKNHVDLVIVGPEQPLVDGVADTFRSLGVDVFGPSQDAARLEGSKIFSKEFMSKHAIPTARYEIVQSVSDVQNAISKFQPPYVLKADGLAAGKGVFICKDEIELKRAARQLFEEKIFGAAGSRALLEEFQPGYEISALALVADGQYELLPFAQDHKRLADGDQGPNTGGMGTIAPMKVDAGLSEQIHRILKQTVHGLQADQMFYRGVIFVGLMITQNGPQVLEYNVRLGDPETQVVLPLLDNDVLAILKDVAQGRMPRLQFKNIFACSVVLAAPGYPEKARSGVEIEGDVHYQTPSSYFLHAGTRKDQAKWLVQGGRVINAVGIGSTAREAIKHAYDQASKIHWQGMQFRKDIGQSLK